MTIEQLAGICFTARNEWFHMNNTGLPLLWSQASQLLKSEYISRVSFHLQNPDETPESYHSAWYKKQEQQGWRYGPRQIEEIKEHPEMLPYYMLPKARRVDDLIFISLVNGLRPMVTM